MELRTRRVQESKERGGKVEEGPEIREDIVESVSDFEERSSIGKEGWAGNEQNVTSLMTKGGERGREQ